MSIKAFKMLEGYFIYTSILRYFITTLIICLKIDAP